MRHPLYKFEVVNMGFWPYSRPAIRAALAAQAAQARNLMVSLGAVIED